MNNWKQPTSTDIHTLRRQEDAYYAAFHMHQPWKVKPRESGYGDGAVDSTWCSIVTKDGSVRIADDCRGVWAHHIVSLHNAWAEQHKDDPQP